jgi:hypothetical protein
VSRRLLPTGTGAKFLRAEVVEHRAV